MFTKVVIFSGLLAVVLSAPAQEPIPIVSQESDINPDGSFQWKYQSGDGTSQEQAGQLQGSGDAAGEAVQGAAVWTDPAGGKHEVRYTADAEGYKPQSSDIPVAPEAPEIPPAIQRALAWNAAHPEQEKV